MLAAGGWKFPDEHKMFAHLLRHNGYFSEMNVLDGQWMGRVTSHVSLREALDQITPETIEQAIHLLNNTMKRAGIENFRWHDLRHTWASWHRQSGTPTHELQRLAHHDQVGVQRARKAADLLHRLAPGHMPGDLKPGTPQYLDWASWMFFVPAFAGG